MISIIKLALLAKTHPRKWLGDVIADSLVEGESIIGPIVEATGETTYNVTIELSSIIHPQKWLSTCIEDNLEFGEEITSIEYSLQ